MKTAVTKILHNFFFASLLFVSTTTCIFAQNNPIENLIKRADSAIDVGELNKAEQHVLQGLAIAKNNNDELSEATLLIKRISIEIEQDNSASIDQWYDRANDILNRKGNKMELANLWNIKARQLTYNQKYKEARELYTKIGAVYLPIGVDPVVAYYYNDLGYLEDAEGNYQKAITLYLKSISIFEKLDDKSGLANTYGNVANAYFNVSETEKALHYAHISLNIRKEIGEKEGIAIVLGNIMRMHVAIKNNDSAKFYQQQYVQYAKLSGKKKTLSDSYANSAIMLYQANMIPEAIDKLQAGIAIAKEINHQNLANYYRLCGLLWSKLKNETASNNYLDTALTLINANKNFAHYRDYYLTLMNINKSKGDYKTALENYDKYVAYKDSVVNENTLKQISQLEIQYETQKKSAQLQEAKAQMAQQKSMYFIIILLLIVILLFVIFWINRMRYRKKIEQKNMLLSERNRIAAELHDEVGSSLSAIHIISHTALQKSSQEPKVKDQLQKIYVNSGHMMESISDIVWSLNPENEKFSRLVIRMKNFALEILEAADITLKMDVDKQFESHKLSPLKSKDLYLIFKEAINNSSKYSKASEIDVQLKFQNNAVLLQVSDNGKGFDMTSEKSGAGLNNMRQRAENNGGTFVMTSNSKGTTIIVTIPYT